MGEEWFDTRLFLLLFSVRARRAGTASLACLHQRCFSEDDTALSVTKTEISPIHTILDLKTCVTFLSVHAGEFDKCSALNSTRSIPSL